MNINNSLILSTKENRVPIITNDKSIIIQEIRIYTIILIHLALRLYGRIRKRKSLFIIPILILTLILVQALKSWKLS